MPIKVMLSYFLERSRKGMTSCAKNFVECFSENSFNTFIPTTVRFLRKMVL